MDYVVDRVLPSYDFNLSIDWTKYRSSRDGYPTWIAERIEKAKWKIGTCCVTRLSVSICLNKEGDSKPAVWSRCSMPEIPVQIPLLLSIGKRQLREGLTVHCQPDLGYQVVFCRCGLRSSNGAGNIGVADPELVIILGVRTEILCFDLMLLIRESPLVKEKSVTFRV